MGSGCFYHSKIEEESKENKPWRSQVTFAVLEGRENRREQERVLLQSAYHHPWPMPNILLQQEVHLARALAPLM